MFLPMFSRTGGMTLPGEKRAAPWISSGPWVLLVWRSPSHKIMDPKRKLKIKAGSCRRCVRALVCFLRVLIAPDTNCWRWAAAGVCRSSESIDLKRVVSRKFSLDLSPGWLPKSDAMKCTCDTQAGQRPSHVQQREGPVGGQGPENGAKRRRRIHHFQAGRGFVHPPGHTHTAHCACVLMRLVLPTATSVSLSKRLKRPCRTRV